jgi:hypothetical protein
MLRNRRLSPLLRKARRPDLDVAASATFQFTFELNNTRACFAPRDRLFVFVVFVRRGRYDRGEAGRPSSRV